MEIVNKEFWEYLLESAGNNDAWWLEGWLEQKLEAYQEIDPCPECGSKDIRHKTIWNETGNYVLEERTICGKCSFVIHLKDKRDRIRQLLKEGEVKVKWVNALKKELED